MMPAIKANAQRLAKIAGVSRRILIVLTDGLDQFAPDANAAHCKLWRDRGIEILGIGLMLESYEARACQASFAGNAVLVNDCARLSTVGLAELVKLLDKAAPRAA